MTRINRIVLSGGGTGGHIYPALALLNELKAMNPSLEVLYIGSERGLEKDLVPQKGIPFKSVPIQGFSRSLSLENIKTIGLMLKSTSLARKYLKEFKPDVVVGTGGYVCGPVLLAASLEKIPTLIHEQNTVAGVTNKFLARFVDRIAITFPGTETQFPKQQDKVVLTGNPRGQEVVQVKKKENFLSKNYGLVDDKPTYLIFGGSQGAPSINKAFIEALPKLSQLPYQAVIATGVKNYQEIKDKIEEKGINIPSHIKLVPYIDNMLELLQEVDLIVSRSGATTLTEITALGVASILIPSPYVTANHQEKNAQTLVDNGAAIMIKEEELNGESLVSYIEQLFSNPTELDKMKEEAKKIGITDASSRIIKELEAIL